MKALLQCGHVSQSQLLANVEGVGIEGQPVCAICAMVVPGWNVINPEPPDLTGRSSKCTYCKSIVPSDYRLPFFKWNSGQLWDSHYDGCRGYE